jgi:hypothetical protein
MQFHIRNLSSFYAIIAIAFRSLFVLVSARTAALQYLRGSDFKMVDDETISARI